MEALLQEKNLKRICILILMSLWAWSVFGESRVEAGVAASAPGDSLGVKTVQGKSFIIYKIAQGETAYAVSRKYGVPFREIAAANPGVDMNALKTGQEILVPVGLNSVPAPAEKKTEPVSQSAQSAGTTSTSSSANAVNPASENNPSQNSTAAIGSDEAGEYSDNTNSFAMMYAAYQSQDMIAVNEKGAATWIENNGIEASGDRFYALSNTAPIGSIIKVRNMMNNRVVYAKVIGRLSESEVNAKVMVKLSAGAGERLNVLDSRFVVEVTYYVNE